MNRLLTWIGEHLSRETRVIIKGCGVLPDWTRYYLLGRTKSRYALMLHRLTASDNDRDLHDHPWPFWSLILTGGYWEITPRKSQWHFGDALTEWKWYQPWSIICRPATWIHRLEIDEAPVWTIVFRFGYERAWGFHTVAGWVLAKDYKREAGCE